MTELKLNYTNYIKVLIRGVSPFRVYCIWYRSHSSVTVDVLSSLFLCNRPFKKHVCRQGESTERNCKHWAVAQTQTCPNIYCNDWGGPRIVREYGPVHFRLGMFVWFTACSGHYSWRVETLWLILHPCCNNKPLHRGRDRVSVPKGTDVLKLHTRCWGHLSSYRDRDM